MIYITYCTRWPTKLTARHHANQITITSYNTAVVSEWAKPDQLVVNVCFPGLVWLNCSPQHFSLQVPRSHSCCASILVGVSRPDFDRVQPLYGSCESFRMLASLSSYKAWRKRMGGTSYRSCIRTPSALRQVTHTCNILSAFAFILGRSSGW